MSKRFHTSRSRRHGRGVRAQTQRQMQPLGCARWMLLLALCLCLFFLITIISGIQAGHAPSLQERKEQILQQELNKGHASSHPKPGLDLQAPVAQTPQPRRAGFINTPQTPFSPSIFMTRNAWQGPVGSQWIIAYAGVQSTPNGTLGQGGLRLYMVGDFALSFLGTFLAPAGTPALTILKAQGDVLLLQTASGRTLTFNLQTHQFQ